jgi:hypothetical protein
MTKRKFRRALIRQVVIALLVAEVELDPRGVKVKGNGVGAQIVGEDALELVEGDVTIAVDVEDAEGDLEIGVGPLQERFKGDELVKVDDAPLLAVGDAEQQGVLTRGDL